MGLLDLFQSRGNVVYKSVSLSDPSVQKQVMKRCIIFDTETTGLDPESERIIEIGAILFENGRPTAKFNTLVNPEREVPASASAINHITTKMVQKAPSEKEVYHKFVRFLDDALKQKTIIIGHNANFDIRFLAATLERLNYDGKIIYGDTLALARTKINRRLIENYKQTTLAKYFNIKVTNAHRADNDALVCGQILFKLLDI